MRIALLYPPPWKIPAPGGAAYAPAEGPPSELREGDLDADFFQMPYGLLALAAQAMRAGHQVRVANLSAWPWDRVDPWIARLDADLFGMSCYTANRRGVAFTAEAIKRHHPAAHVVVGGPHASALAPELLAHHEGIDSVAVGEGELTLLELAHRLQRQEPIEGIPGLATRTHRASPRARIDDLDSLASPHEHFATHIVMTSRGCPGRCSYCAKDAVWGRPWKALSVGAVLDRLEQAVARVPVRMLMIKDDTFTADRRRALAVCEGIRQRGIHFLWSCDTRADALNDDLLRAMRLAGCQRISLGVESGSPSVLRAIGKNLTPDRVAQVTRAARRYGLQVRYFMMLGNRGESQATIRESLEFLRRSEPDQYVFACLSVYPGTRDAADLEKLGYIHREDWFGSDFLELKMPFDASEADLAAMSRVFEEHRGLRDLRRPTLAECRDALSLLGDHHAAHLDVAGAAWRAGDPRTTRAHASRALELGLPVPGLALNYLACAASLEGDRAAMLDALREAESRDPLHAVLQQNLRTVRAWSSSGSRGELPALSGSHDFGILERPVQPMLPGPLPDDFATWPSPR